MVFEGQRGLLTGSELKVRPGRQEGIIRTMCEL